MMGGLDTSEGEVQYDDGDRTTLIGRSVAMCGDVTMIWYILLVGIILMTVKSW